MPVHRVRRQAAWWLFSHPKFSETRASVVGINAAIEAAFWRAQRATLAGSRIPSRGISAQSSVAALKPKFGSFESRTFATTTAPFVAGVGGDQPRRFFESALHNVDSDLASLSRLSFSRAGI